MSDFNEAFATEQHLVNALIVARQKNEVLTENNRRLERLLIKCIEDLQDASRLMNELSNATDDLVAKVLER